MKVGQHERLHLNISDETIKSVEERGSFWRTVGWSLVGAGVVSLGAGGGMWFGPFADAKSTRDQTLEAWLSADDSNYDRLTQQLSDNDADVQSWQRLSAISLGSGVVLSGLGALTLWLAPSVERNGSVDREDVGGKVRRRKKLERDADRALREVE